MSTRNQSVRPTDRRKSTRAQRRVAERVEAKKRATQPQRRKTPLAGIIGAAVTIVAVLIVVLYALLRTNNTGKGITDPKLLNPRSSLLKVGSMAPDFALRDANGVSHHLAAERGHAMLLEFFAVWCPHCQAEAPTIARLTQNFAPAGAGVWSILANPYGRNYDQSGGTDTRLANEGDLSWFAQTFKVRHPQLIDPTFKVVNQYGAGSYPTLYVVSSSGRIAYANSGEQPYANLAKALTRAEHT